MLTLSFSNFAAVPGQTLFRGAWQIARRVVGRLLAATTCRGDCGTELCAAEVAALCVRYLLWNAATFFLWTSLFSDMKPRTLLGASVAGYAGFLADWLLLALERRGVLRLALRGVQRNNLAFMLSTTSFMAVTLGPGGSATLVVGIGQGLAVAASIFCARVRAVRGGCRSMIEVPSATNGTGAG